MFANDAGVALEHHSADISHAGAVFEQDTDVRVAFDIGNLPRPISHTHNDVAAKAEISQGHRVREAIVVDGAQYRPAWAAIKVRLNLFGAQFTWHGKRLTRTKAALGVAGSA
jgi:hypothetical protein